ncbi:MAG: hypothetical protein ACE5EV_00960, partial [Gaiellales bacterium]
MARAVSGVLVGLAVLAGLVGGLLAVPSLALGSGTSLQFGTTRLLGQDFEHERITRAALACAPGTKSNGSCFEPRSIAQLAGEGGTFGGVGAPDIPPPESAPAHCDDADYLNVRGYPHSLRARNRAFRACRTYMTTRWFAGIRESPPLLDANDRIIPGEVDLSSNCTFLGQLRGRAKCNVFDRFGRALHAMQDFYAHSNWADQPRPRCGGRDRRERTIRDRGQHAAR